MNTTTDETQELAESDADGLSTLPSRHKRYSIFFTNNLPNVPLGNGFDARAFQHVFAERLLTC